MAFPDGWGRRCALVIQSGQVTDNEVNFPLLVTEDTLPSEMFDADGSYPALNGGGDIRFSSDEAGDTQLACEIESFVTDNNPANGKASIWAKVPSLSSSSNTTIYIWYDKVGESQPAEDNAYGKENVWDSNFKMVQHMNQDPSGDAPQMIDSTSNDNDGTSGGTMLTEDQVAGQIDGSLDFDGGGDYVEVGTTDSLINREAITISAWFQLNSDYTSSQAIVIDATSASYSDYALMYGYTDNKLESWQTNGGPTITSDLSITDNNLHHVAVTRSGSSGDWTFNLYIDGNLDKTDTTIENPQTNANMYCSIGRYGAYNGFYFDGIIDEVRISNTARTAGWIATEYNNQYTPGTFLIEGTPETPGAPPSAYIPQIIMF